MDNLCFCGNQTITHDDSYIHSCCYTESCFKDYDGHVKCEGGVKQTFNFPCHGECKQFAAFGFNTILCKNQQQCVKEITLCRGHPMCAE